ncbi:MAG TPA: hypothetical protein PLW24_25215, partial [Burkholderiaceae bacterium]|nr:hypothetical protein [Burkholderiaceae bacterium]
GTVAGVGSALLRYCADVACACGAPQLEGEVLSGDLAAQAFCTRHGFAATPRHKSASGEWFLTVRRRVPAPAWPLWDLRRLHAPRVPPAVLERMATRALFEAWLGRSTLRPQAQSAAASTLHTA